MGIETREFHLGDLLSVTAGRILSPSGPDGIFALLSWMTGERLYPFQLARVAAEARVPLLAQHPDLAAVTVPDGMDSQDKLTAWLTGLAATLGETRAVAPLAPGEYTQADPVTELQALAPRAAAGLVIAPGPGSSRSAAPGPGGSRRAGLRVQ